jgi:hypothetical protein
VKENLSAKSFFFLTLVFSLICTGILNSNTISIDAFAKKIQRSLLMETSMIGVVVAAVAMVMIKTAVQPAIQMAKLRKIIKMLSEPQMMAAI